MKRSIKVKEKELIDRLNSAAKDKKKYQAPQEVHWDASEGTDETVTTVYKDGNVMGHYTGNDAWKNEYFAGKDIKFNQVDLNPVKNMTDDEKALFNLCGPCSVEDINRDSLKDAKETRSDTKGVDKCLGITKKAFKHTPTEREQQLIDILNGVAANKENKDTQLRTPKEQNRAYEEVNHPQHYNNYDVEVIDMMEKIFGKSETAIFCKLNAFKYRMRAGTKPNQSAEKDLAKERWYLNKKAELEH